MEILTNCPICKSKHIFYKSTIVDHSISGEKFDLFECKQCEFLFTNPRPDKIEINSYYASENYISHSDKLKNPIDLLYKTARYLMLRKKRKLLEKHTHKGNLLDIGCGTGHFLEHCKENGWNVTGIETDDKTRNNTQKRKKLDIFKSIFEISDDKIFNAITLWHVLEHIHDIDTTMEFIYKHLSDKGTLFIALPNRDSYDALYYGEYWAGYDVPRHLYHFSDKNIMNYLSKYKLNITEKIPMPLDAYYVSILSYSYKYGKKSYIKSFYHAYISNKKALKNNKNYSSNIFVVQK
ncbi:MAG: class I SAM-dependent methyltransferase [Cyclobacteriaceae bacterium]|nr:class I SAM-dependent methyltransferase [Cyclobacteriaceae bacterium]